MSERSSLFLNVLAALLVIVASALSGFGKDITLAWDLNPEPSVTGYKLYYGTTPQNYSNSIDVGNVTTYVLRGLPEGTYYFTVSAYNQATLESDFSNEVFSGPLTLYYPRLTSAGGASGQAGESTGLALVNLSQAPATLRLTALDLSGSQPAGAGITNPAVKSMDPGKQVPFVETEVFGSALTSQSPTGWGSIDSSVAELSGFFLIFDSNLNTLDGGNTDLTPLTSSVLAEVEDQGYCRVSVINPRAESVTVNIDLVAANPANSGTVSRVLQPQAALLADLAKDLFPANSPSAGDYVRVRSNPGVIVSELLGKTGKYLEYLPGQDSGGGGSLLYSPQYAVGDYWRTSISVVNLDSTAGTVAFRLIGQDGHQIGSTRTLPIAANGKVQVSDPGFFGVPGGSSLTQGYVEIRTSGVKAVGSVVFGDPARSLSAAALPLVSRLDSSLLFKQVASSQLWYTGLAIVNPGQDAATATIEVFNADGSPAMSKDEAIPAGGRTSGLLAQFFPALASTDRTSGYIRVTSNRPVAAFALFGTNTGSALSAIPAQSTP
jgi:hypothetical protein